LPMCQLKVKVTIEGQISNNQILDSMSCPLCTSYTKWKIFFNLGSNVHPTKECAEPMLPFCRLKVKVTLEGKTWEHFEILTRIWIFLKLEKVLAWNLTYIWSITISIYKSSFITLYCTSTKLCPCWSLQIYLRSNVRQYVVSAL